LYGRYRMACALNFEGRLPHLGGGNTVSLFWICLGSSKDVVVVVARGPRPPSRAGVSRVIADTLPDPVDGVARTACGCKVLVRGTVLQHVALYCERRGLC
jgi:hypothetical protein